LKTFFCKLVPPRVTFAQDLSQDEAKIMQEHAVYWRGLMDKGQVVTFGFVADPAGAWGMGVLEIPDDSDAGLITANDPAIRSGRGFRYEIYPMPRGAVHPPKGTISS
jgi:uncharacterized protein